MANANELSLRSLVTNKVLEKRDRDVAGNLNLLLPVRARCHLLLSTLEQGACHIETASHCAYDMSIKQL